LELEPIITAVVDIGSIRRRLFVSLKGDPLLIPGRELSYEWESVHEARDYCE
jgi:hypothetical protein